MRPAISALTGRHDLSSIEDLDRNILTLCTRINAATYELLVLIREFDERAGWLQWGLSNCADWLAWRCDLSKTTALEKVRAAHALKVLPAISRAFSSGERLLQSTGCDHSRKSDGADHVERRPTGWWDDCSYYTSSAGQREHRECGRPECRARRDVG